MVIFPTVTKTLNSWEAAFRDLSAVTTAQGLWKSLSQKRGTFDAPDESHLAERLIFREHTAESDIPDVLILRPCDGTATWIE